MPLLNHKYRKVLLYLVFIALLYFPLFSHLGVLPIRIWDESRLAINASEMLSNGDFIVTHFDDEPDMWNTKPPLMIWSQVFWMKVIGVNELAIRLPSAISGFLLCIFIWFFSRQFFETKYLGLIAAIILISFPGFVSEHVTRTGDYDAMLTMFTSMASLSIFLFSYSNKSKYLYWFFIALTLGVLTKSIAALLFLPGIFLYFLYKKQVLKILMNRSFYWGLLIFLVGVIGYYLLRESQNEGYLNAAFKNDMGGRYNDALDNHKGGFWFYYNYLISSHISYWYLLLPISYAFGLFSKNSKFRDWTIFSLFISLSYFLVISSAETKIEWYDAPLLPVIAIQVAILVYFIANYLSKISYFKEQLVINIFPIAFVFLILITPYKNIINKTFSPEELSWEKSFYEPEYWLKNYIKHGSKNEPIQVLKEDYCPHWNFYIRKAANLDFPIELVPYSKIGECKNLLVFRNGEQIIEEKYSFKLLESNGQMRRYEILGDSIE